MANSFRHRCHVVAVRHSHSEIGVWKSHGVIATPIKLLNSVERPVLSSERRGFEALRCKDGPVLHPNKIASAFLNCNAAVDSPIVYLNKLIMKKRGIGKLLLHSCNLSLFEHGAKVDKLAGIFGRVHGWLR